MSLVPPVFLSFFVMFCHVLCVCFLSDKQVFMAATCPRAKFRIARVWHNVTRA